VLYTYDRLDNASETLLSVLSRTHYSGDLHVHIADDGSPDPGYIESLREIAAGFEHVVTVGHSNAERAGYGGSYNLASQQTHSHHEILMPLEDDWRLERDLDLDPLVDTLLTDDRVECIRLGYLSFTQSMRGELIHTPVGVGLLLDPESEEPHVFAGHPRLETREFQRRVGPWPEGLPAGTTEFDVAHRPEARTGILWPMQIVKPAQGDLFSHIGARGLGELWPGQE
jgi:hypothetical protein